MSESKFLAYININKIQEVTNDSSDSSNNFCSIGWSARVIIILEDDPAISSAEALAIKRLENLGDPQEWITGVEAEEEIDEDELREWVKSCGY